MRTRTIQSELLQLATEFPVVSIYGPRQSGKTTLARMTFPDKPYISLENPDTLFRAQKDPRGFFADLSEGAILDEVQRAPELLSYLQGVVDADRRPGRFILTGSHQARLRNGVAQSLAGRTAVLTLLPYSLEESPIEPASPHAAFQAVFRGFFPQLRESSTREKSFFSAYVATYLERDLPGILSVRNVSLFRDFLFLVASRVGQLVNAHSLSDDLGVSVPTISAWISALEQSGIVFRLRGYSRNATRQVVKAPKLYFTDTGLAAWLAGFRDVTTLEGGAVRGGLYENLVVIDILKRSLARASGDRLWFYRDAKGNEVDLVIERGTRLIPVEIKSSSTFDASFIRGIRHFRNMYPQTSKQGIVFLNDPEASGSFDGIRIANPLRDCPLYDAL